MRQTLRTKMYDLKLVSSQKSWLELVLKLVSCQNRIGYCQKGFWTRQDKTLTTYSDVCRFESQGSSGSCWQHPSLSHGGLQAVMTLSDSGNTNRPKSEPKNPMIALMGKKGNQIGCKSKT